MFGRGKRTHTETASSGAPSLQNESERLAVAGSLSDSIFDNLVIPLKLERGFSSFVIAAVLGSLAGHACQVATIRGLKAGDPAFSGLSVATVEGANGDAYLYGDAINRPVLERDYSVWALVAGICREVSCTVPDIHELVGYVATTLGTKLFGMPRDLPSGPISPREALSLWEPWAADAENATTSDLVPIAFAMAYQRLAQTDNAVDPSVDQATLARIMMESTVAMSRLLLTPLDLATR